MRSIDRLGELAYRQLYLPARDFAFVGAMVAMTALSIASIGGAASPMVADMSPPMSVIADPAANDNRSVEPDKPGPDQVVRPIRG
jgi:hypothetical protein